MEEGFEWASEAVSSPCNNGQPYAMAESMESTAAGSLGKQERRKTIRWRMLKGGRWQRRWVMEEASKEADEQHRG